MTGKEILSVEDFRRYGEKGRLGKLYFPNGVCNVLNGNRFEHRRVERFNVDLGELFRNLNGSRDGLVSVVAYGPSVDFSKKNPENVDFLVLSDGSGLRDSYDSPIYLCKECDDESLVQKSGQSCEFKVIAKPGVHVSYRGVDELVCEVRKRDKTSEGYKALSGGAFLFNNSLLNSYLRLNFASSN